MESAAIHTSPGTSLSGILLSVRTQYSPRPEYENKRYKVALDRSPVLCAPVLFSGKKRFKPFG